MSSIVPLPVFEKEADPTFRDSMTLEEQHAALEPPKTIVVKFGAMQMVGEYQQAGGLKPGCGSKLVARTHRGLELVEMLTTCTNSGCGKSISREEMRSYINNSGGRDFPFYNRGRVLRVATAEDMASNAKLMARKPEFILRARELAAYYNMDMKIVDVDPILGEEVLTFFYMTEDRIDFRELVRDLAADYRSRIEMRQVGARDEARLVADYEKCGQHCCCKNFLKVLKPVSMRSAKVQKATLDPLKISGRCGRLMCCLRYEDQTYKELKSNLPHRKTRVGTELGPGIVIDSKILTQLVLVKLEHNNEEIAIPLEELMDPDSCPSPAELEAEARAKEAAAQKLLEDSVARARSGREKSRQGGTGEGKKKRRRRRRGKGKGSKAATASDGSTADQPKSQAQSSDGDTPKPKKKRRRRRRKKTGGNGGSSNGQSGGGES